MEQPIAEPEQNGFFDRHTIIGTVLLIVLSYLFILIPAAAATGFVCAFFRLGDYTDYLGFAVVPMALLVLLLYWIILRPHYKGILFRGFTRTLRCCPVILIYWLLLFLPDFLEGCYPHTFTLKVISIAVTAGFSEEVIFRGLPMSYLKRQLRSEKQVPLIVCITGIVFGLIHLTNILIGASVSASLVQFVTASFIGIFFGAVLMRGGNIFVPILLHSLHDMLILAFQEADEVSAVLSEEATGSDIIPTVLSVALGIFGFFLIRKSKRGEICRMWADTWSQSTENQPEIPAEPKNTMEV